MQSMVPIIEEGRIIRIVDKDTLTEITAKINSKLEKGGTLADLDGKPQIVEGFRFPKDYDQGQIPYFSTAHQLIKVASILKLFGMTIEEYRNSSQEMLMQKMAEVGARLNTYLETSP